MEYLALVPYAVGGTLIASTLALVPALHVYNVAGIFILLALRVQDLIGADQLAMLLLGMIVGYAVVNTVSAIFLGAPDDSTVFLVLPGQKYLMMSRGYEAVVLSGIGALGGVAVLIVLAPFASVVFGTLRGILLPHLHWILAVVIAYMLIWDSTPAPTSVPGAGTVYTSKDYFERTKGEFGYDTIEGTVFNRTNKPVRFVQIRGTMLDASGATINFV